MAFSFMLDFTAMRNLIVLNAAITECTACPRLVRHRREVARVKRRQFKNWDYWGRPVPGFGDPHARLYVQGLAPAAHGGNRTGRIFTGDRSGDWLYAALHRYGFANQPTSVHRDDGLALTDCYVGATVRCAPPDNKPLPEEFERCRRYLLEEIRLLPRVRVVIALGKIAFDHYLKARQLAGLRLDRPTPKFGHGKAYRLADGILLLGSYHPSQQNTFTGKLTRPMFHAVFELAAQELGRRRGGRRATSLSALPSRPGTS